MLAKASGKHAQASIYRRQGDSHRANRDPLVLNQETLLPESTRPLLGEKCERKEGRLFANQCQVLMFDQYSSDVTRSSAEATLDH